MTVDLKENPTIALMITEKQYQLYFNHIKDEFENNFNLRFIDPEKLKTGSKENNYLKEKLHDVKGCITSWGTPTINNSILNLMPGLEIVAHGAGSVKNIVTDEVYQKGIAVTSCHMALAPTVAETTLMLTLMGLKLYQHQRKRLDRGQGPARELVGYDLGESQVGLIGYGRIARCFRKLLKSFNVNVMVYDPYLTEEDLKGEEVSKVEFEELLKKCNVISLHAPGTEANDCLIDANAMSIMQDDTLIVNTARGILIDEDALYQELQSGRLRAALDVFRKEPLSLDSPFRELDNVILTPHIGGKSVDSRKRIGEIVMAELQRYFRGNELLYRAQPSELKRRA